MMKYQAFFWTIVAAAMTLFACAKNTSAPKNQPTTQQGNEQTAPSNSSTVGQDRPVPPASTQPEMPKDIPPAGFQKPKPIENPSKDCFDPSKATKEECGRLYDPVCGCNNVTYPSECAARTEGVLKWTKGACK